MTGEMDKWEEMEKMEKTLDFVVIRCRCALTQTLESIEGKYENRVICLDILRGNSEFWENRYFFLENKLIKIDFRIFDNLIFKVLLQS